MTAPVYSIEALSTGQGRNGHVRTMDGALDFEMRRPLGMGGDGRGVNPEQLFAAGYAACFHSALHSVARSRKLVLEDSSVGVRVSLMRSDTGVDLAVHLEVHVPNLPIDQVRELAEATHQVCPYSKATHGNIEVTTDVTED